MDDVSARLEALLRSYAASIDRGGDEIAQLVDDASTRKPSLNCV